MTEEKEESASEEITFKASEIKKHVGELLIYMDDEKKDYDAQLEDNPEQAKNHIWLNIEAIANCIGLTVDDAWELYKFDEAEAGSSAKKNK